MKHSDELSEKVKSPSKLVAHVGTKIVNTKLQNAKHKITRNRQTDRHAHATFIKPGKYKQKYETNKHDRNLAAKNFRRRRRKENEKE